MVRYKNLGGNSGIYAFEIGDNNIKVHFNDGAIYLYTYESTGTSNIETMKKLASSGQGLNSFIVREVKNNYAAKLK